MALPMRIPYLVVLAAFFASALLVAIYWSGLHGGYFFDDGPSILQAEGIRIENLSVESLRQVFLSGHAGPSGRPIAQLSFALDYYFSGFNPFVFKATNLAIHLACGILVLRLTFLLLTMALPQAKRENILVATGCMTALWLLHPIQLLPVLHVVQRMTSLSAFFLLAALLLHIRGRELSGRTGAALLMLAWGIFWPLSFFSKETGALFPLFVLTWELIVWRGVTGRLDLFARGFVMVVALALVAATAYFLLPRGQWLWAGYELRGFSLAERLLTEGRILWFYIGLIVTPRLEAFGLYHDDIALSTGLFAPWTTLPALIGLAGLVWLTWRTRTRAPLVSFGIAWFLIGHAMESTVLPLEIAHEHRNYLPIFGILIAAAWALIRALESSGTRKTIGITLTVAALVYFPFITALRSHQFENDGLRSQIEAQHHRQSAHAQFDAGSFLAGLPESASPNSPIYSFARASYELASKLDPDFKLGWLGLIQLNCTAGKAVEREWIEELSRRLQSTPFGPADRNVLYDLKEMSIAGTLCLARKDMEKLFSASFANPTVSPSVRAILYSWYADFLLLRENDIPAAHAALAKSLQLNPGNASNRLKWAQLIFLEGQKDDAARLLKHLDQTSLSNDEKRTAINLLGCLERSGPCGKI